MRALRPRLARSTFLGLLLLVGTAEDCDPYAPRSCTTDYDCGGGVTYSCQATMGERVCLPTDPAQYAAVVSAYMNKKAQQCAAEGHQLAGRMQTSRLPVPGKPSCQQVIKQQVCKRCKSNITVAIGYEGDCGDLPPVSPCQ